MESKKCENWYVNHRYVSKEEVMNFLLHELYCKRNIVKCEQCEVRIDQALLDEHLLEHAKVKCDHCEKMIEARDLDKHKKQCAQAPIQCEFCDLPFSVSELPIHQSKCATRTDQCEVCKKHIKKIEQKSHELICHDKKPKRQRLQRLQQSDSDVEEILPPRNTRRAANRKPSNSDEDEDFQKALELSLGGQYSQR